MKPTCFVCGAEMDKNLVRCPACKRVCMIRSEDRAFRSAMIFTAIIGFGFVAGICLIIWIGNMWGAK